MIVVLGVAWQACSWLIAPTRRTLQDYHQEILAHAADHGMRIEAFAAPQIGTAPAPCLMCEALPNPGVATKGNLLRSQLTQKGLAVPAWGEIKGTIVMLHGHKGRKEDFLPMAERFCAAGFRCLMVDLPGQGENQ